MKKMKKLAGLILAMVMVLAMTVTAFAEETYSVTINNENEGHVYEAYQIFTGSLGENKELGNLAWGSGVSEEGKNALGDAKTIAATLEVESDAEAFASEVGPYLTIPTGTDNSVEDGKYVISGLTPGYYLIKDQTGSLDGDNDSYTEYILKVVADVVTEPKADVPEVEKKVDDKNDSNSTEDEVIWQDSADYDIGDAVPFQLKATLANNVSAYETYKIVFHDTLSEGLTYNGDAKVYFNGTDVTSYFTITCENGALTIFCDDVKAFGATDSSVITVEYTATLNDKAALGAAGNPNTVYLEYSNNPNWDAEGTPDDEEPTGNTPEDKVIVFTYKVVVNKIDENGNPLPGAGFTLYKKDAEGNWTAIGEELKGTDLTTFKWTGLDDGDYKLEETTTPAGYNTIDPIEFTITAEHDMESDNPKLTALSGGDLFTGEVNTGTLTADVENKKGATLPDTGGMGTTVFYVAGAVLVIGTAVVFVTKKRMGTN